MIDYKASNDEAKERLFGKLKDMLANLGMHHDHLLPHHAYLKNEIPVAGCAHRAGTCRFGADPATSVLDPDCRAQRLADRDEIEVTLIDRNNHHRFQPLLYQVATPAAALPLAPVRAPETNTPPNHHPGL